MERTPSIFIGIFLVLFLVLPSSSWATEQPSHKWEYKVIRAGDFDGDAPINRLDEWQRFMETEMNKLGQRHWELVSVDRANGLVIFFFKRPID